MMKFATLFAVVLVGMASTVYSAIETDLTKAIAACVSNLSSSVNLGSLKCDEIVERCGKTLISCLQNTTTCAVFQSVGSAINETCTDLAKNCISAGDIDVPYIIG